MDYTYLFDFHRILICKIYDYAKVKA